MKNIVLICLYCGNPACAGQWKARTMRFGMGAPMIRGWRKACVPPKKTSQ